jgi:hypothetical protein
MVNFRYTDGRSPCPRIVRDFSDVAFVPRISVAPGAGNDKCNRAMHCAIISTYEQRKADGYQPASTRSIVPLSEVPREG